MPFCIDVGMGMGVACLRYRRGLGLLKLIISSLNATAQADYEKVRVEYIC